MPPSSSLHAWRAAALAAPCAVRIAARSATASSSLSSTSSSLLSPALFRTQIRTYRQPVPAEGPPIPSPTAQRPDIPPYPYGDRQVFKQANKGLYGNARIQFGNTVSRETEIINPQKTRRKWWPNIQEKRLYSEALGVAVRTRVNTRVLRTIDKVGGLDAYLLGSKPARIAELGPWGWRLRWRIMQTPTVQARFQREREALGLPAAGLAAEVLEGDDGAVEQGHEAADTQRMLDGGELFDMAPQEGFMAETTDSKTPA